MLFRHVLSCTVLFASMFALGESARGATLIENRSASNAIPVPRFDPALGTLTDVEFRVTLVGGTTNIGLPHNHVFDPAPFNVPNNIAPGQTIDFPPLNSTTNGTHNHTVNTGNFSANGLTVPNFNFTVSTTGSHSHTVDFPLQQVVPGGILNIPATISTAQGTLEHSFSSQVQVLNFSGGGVTPFLLGGTSDFFIPTGPLNANINGAHTHSVDPPPRTLNTIPFGTTSINLPPVLSMTSGNHGHTIDPRWQTRTTFTFTPVIPEPATALLATMAAIGLAAMRRTKSSFSA